MYGSGVIANIPKSIVTPQSHYRTDSTPTSYRPTLDTFSDSGSLQFVNFILKLIYALSMSL